MTWFRVLPIACALVAVTCAEQRPPINRVQPYALDKEFFIGEDFADSADDPQFWTQAVWDGNYVRRRRFCISHAWVSYRPWKRRYDPALVCILYNMTQFQNQLLFYSSGHYSTSHVRSA